MFKLYFQFQKSQIFHFNEHGVILFHRRHIRTNMMWRFYSVKIREGLQLISLYILSRCLMRSMAWLWKYWPSLEKVNWGESFSMFIVHFLYMYQFTLDLFTYSSVNNFWITPKHRCYVISKKECWFPYQRFYFNQTKQNLTKNEL
jgi:hypothetical protein